MERYDIYMYNVPVVSEAGKVVPIAPHETHDCSELEEARKLAAERKDQFDRVVVIQTADDTQKLVDRFIEGMHDVPEKPEKDAPGKPEEKDGEDD